MSGNGEHGDATAPVSLSAHKDARAIVRLVQCSQCSYPLREPMTLPCGHSICRPCLPPIFKRENITYPPTQGRSEGFLCPFKNCRLEHSLGDCSLDVTLSKLLDVIKTYIASYKAETSETPIQLDEKLNWPDVVDNSIDIMPRSRVLHGGRIVATYVFADMGELNYHSDVGYTLINESTSESINALDVAVLETLKEVTRNELECQVCYAVMLDPLTTSCGHTFCRRCVARVLDHSNLCPICRRRLPLAPGVQGEPSNKRISLLVQGLLPDLLAARVATSELDNALDQDDQMPLFPCTLAFPMMPTFLHIFEPRYRLMIRRVIENGTRRFGMIMYNQHGVSQGSLGQVHFMQYGTVLHIDRIEMLPDGRSLVETRGMSRFKVLEAQSVDGYNVGRIQRVDDISIAEEQGIEAREVGGAAPGAEDVPGQVDHMSTQRLLDYGLSFTSEARSRSARWLHQRVISAYGQPPTDPALFPYWFASVLPIAEEEKYQLLPTTSVRERLKITARWIQRLEAASREFEAELRAAQLQATAASRRAAEAEIARNRVQQQESVAVHADGHSMSPAEADVPSSQETTESVDAETGSLPELEGDPPQSIDAAAPTDSAVESISSPPVETGTPPEHQSHRDRPDTPPTNQNLISNPSSPTTETQEGRL